MANGGGFGGGEGDSACLGLWGFSWSWDCICEGEKGFSNREIHNGLRCGSQLISNPIFLMGLACVS